jgi:hypothetical protein
MVKCKLYTYDNESKGVSAGLRAVQFLFVDDSLGGSAEATDEGFDTVADAHTASGGSSDAEYDPFADE